MNELLSNRERDTLVIAVSKGRILDTLLPLLARVGIEPVEDLATSRKLIIGTSRPGVYLVIIRATDVPTYVEYGAADLGVAGKDVLLECAEDGFYEPLDLGIARCRLVVAAPAAGTAPERRLRVATKYEKTTRSWFARRGVQAEVIKLYGSMELAPLAGLADKIVDLVETGNTLRANGLVAEETICEISARLIVNKAAMKVKHELVTELLNAFREAIPATAEGTA